jgi:hypothetical protein
MSKGLGRIERAILDLIEADDDIYDAEVLAHRIYGPDPDDDMSDADFLALSDDERRAYNARRWRPSQAEYTAVLRAMHTLARKYPEKVRSPAARGVRRCSSASRSGSRTGPRNNCPPSPEPQKMGRR